MKRIIFLLSLMVTVSCTNKVKERILVVPAQDPEVEMGGGANQNKVRAEKLVESAEELVSPIGFMLADQILEAALKNDPTNRKAQFYRAIIAPLMKTRGMLVRLAPLRNQFPRLFQDMSIAGGALGDFLRDRSAGPLIKNEEDLQKLLGEIQIEQKKITDFISKNKGFLTRISVSYVYNAEKMFKACSVSRISTNTYRLSPCAHFQQIKLRVNRGDWEVFYQLANGSRMGAAALLSYNLDGLLNYHKLIEQNRANKKRMSSKDRVEFLSQYPNNGKILPNHQMDIIRDKSVDTYSGLKWLMDVQPQLCSDSSTRSEHAVKRVCLNKPVPIGRVYVSSGSALDLLRMSIGGHGGTVKTVEREKDKENYAQSKITSIRMDVLAPAKFALEDLKVLLPKSFDACGNTTSLNDPTFGGIFPSADADNILLKAHKYNCNPLKGAQ